jgi:phenylacetate-CoA ligase
VPFWRRRLDAAGIAPGEVRGVADLPALPPVTKAEIVAEPRDAIARGVDLARCVSFSTSGTTGEPLTLYALPDAIRVHRATQLRALLAAGFRPRDRLVVLGPGRALPSGWHQRLGVYRRDHVWPTEPVDEQIAALGRLSPDLLWIYPSCLYAILERTGFRLSAVCRPRTVLTSAEVFGGEEKERLRAEGIDHFDLYGCVEFGRIAWECPAHEGLHVNADHLVLEVLGDHGRCPQTGVRLGEAVVTSLANRTMPLVRYRLGDVVGLLDGPCACGSAFPRITHPLGRTRDLLRLPDGRAITAGPMTHVLRARAWIARFQIVQESVRELRLRVAVRRPPEPDEIAALERDARAYIGGETAVTVEVVERIEQGEGKFRDVIGLPAPARPAV